MPRISSKVNPTASFNPFAAARNSVPADAPTPKKPGKAEVAINGLAKYVAICQIEKRLEALKARLSGDPKRAIHEQFVTKAVETSSVPTNFDGIEGSSKASCQMRRKGYALKPEAAEILSQHNIPVGEQEVYSFNPEHMTPALMKIAGEALGKLIEQGKLPKDFIQYEKKLTVTDDSVKAVCSLKNDKNLTAKSKIGMLLPMVTDIAIRPTLGDGSDVDISEALQNLLED